MTADRAEQYSLEQLVGRRRKDLPGLCNVLVRLDEHPHFHENQGGHWLLKAKGVTSSESAWIAVHRDPSVAGLGLGYGQTLPELLQMFDDRLLRRGLMPGELALVQAHPGIGDEGRLYLNVPAVLIVRPFLTFGRRQIDFSSDCARNSYLHLAKGARHHGDDRQSNTFLTYSVAGELVHDIVSRWAESPEFRGEKLEELSPDTLHPGRITDLVLLGVGSEDAIGQTLGMALQHLRVAAKSREVSALLDSDQWVAESEALNNGVCMSPDLLGTRSVVEIKVKNPSSDQANPAEDERQLESYLAWAMVKFGVEYVLENVRGVLLQLHKNVSDADRVAKYKPERQMLGRRIRNRHRLLTLASGGWLPAPNDAECNQCRFSTSDADPGSGGRLPGACEYYCQQERGWDCVQVVEGEHTPCPLIHVCDQFDQYGPYERSDRFNRLREVLLAEEEEMESLEQAIESLVGDESELGFMLRGFEVVRHAPGRVTLRPPARLSRLRFAVPGDAYTVFRDGRRVAMVHYERPKGGNHRFRVSGSATLGVPEGEQVDLRVRSGERYPVRLQLAELDRIQRADAEPIWIRGDAREDQLVEVRDHLDVGDALAADAEVVLVDAPGKARQIDLAEEVLRHSTGRSLVVAPSGAGWQPSDSVVDLAPDSVAFSITNATGTCESRLAHLAKAVRNASVWRVDRETLHSGRLTKHWWLEPGYFMQVVVLCTESFPLLALSSCLEIGSRLVLIGDRAATGPRAESRRARNSHFYSNSLRFLWQAGSFALPSRVKRVSRLQVPADALRELYERLLDDDELDADTGDRVRIHRVDGTATMRSTNVELETEVPASEAANNRFEVVARILDDIDHRELRTMIRAVSVHAIEALGVSRQGELDRALLGCKVRIEKVTCESQSGLTKRPHRLRLALCPKSSGHPSRYDMVNLREVEAVIAFAEAQGTDPMTVVAPFPGMAAAIASKADDHNIENLEVWTLEAFAHHAERRQRTLLFPFTVTDARPSYPPPLNDSRSLAPLFVPEIKALHLFASESVMKHHPLLRRLDSQFIDVRSV